jgi:copper chaperone NosL
MDLEPQMAPRRGFLHMAGGVVFTSLAGCQGNKTNHSPISIEEDHSCPVCNMIVHNHPGPSGHSVYPDNSDVSGVQDGIVPFCSSICAYDYYFKLKESGITPKAMFLTDYSKVDWEVYEQSGTKFISPHFSANAQTTVGDLTFVVASDVLGAMGESAIGFSDRDEAAEFSSEHGGDIYSHGEITRELIESLGFS